MKSTFYSTFLSLLFASSGLAGSFILSDISDFEPFIIVHPPGYDGTGGVIRVDICIGEDSSILRQPAQEAIAVWNALEPGVENCENCQLIEESSLSGEIPDFLFMSSTLIHEFGHCPFGLDHINWREPSGASTSFTTSRDAISISAGTDGIRGSADDSPSPLPGTRLLHWFRIADNNPFAIDGTEIDSSTFSRRILDLPPGSNWPASGNRGVGDALGLKNTQGVMYSAGLEGQRYTSLTADDLSRWSLSQ
jgi:hypothetical protein